MLRKIFRRLFKLKKNHVSLVDRMLDKRRLNTPASLSQQVEIDKHRKIAVLRDQSST